MSYCQIEGYNYPFEFKKGTRLFISGNGAFFRNCRFYTHAYRSSSDNYYNNGLDSIQPIIIFYPTPINGGMNVIFEDCYFRDFWSSNKNHLYISAGKSLSKDYLYHGHKAISNPCINYKFIRCVFANDSSDSLGRKLRNNSTKKATWDYYLHIALKATQFNPTISDSLSKDSYKLGSKDNILSKFGATCSYHTGVFVETQNSYNDYDVNAVYMDASGNSSNRIVTDGSVYTYTTGMDCALLDVLADKTQYKKTK